MFHIDSTQIRPTNNKAGTSYLNLITLKFKIILINNKTVSILIFL